MLCVALAPACGYLARPTGFSGAEKAILHPARFRWFGVQIGLICIPFPFAPADGWVCVSLWPFACAVGGRAWGAWGDRRYGAGGG